MGAATGGASLELALPRPIAPAGGGPFPRRPPGGLGRAPRAGRHGATGRGALSVRFRERILFGTDVQMGRSGSWVLGSAGEDPDPPERIPVFYEAHWRYFETADRSFRHPTPIQGDWTIDIGRAHCRTPVT